MTSSKVARPSKSRDKRPTKGNAATSGETRVRSNGPTQAVATVDRAIDILKYFAESNAESMGVTEIANDISMSKATVHRILNSLRSHGLIQFDEGSRRYSLGPTTMTLGLSYLARLDVRRLALPVLHQLSVTTHETATLSIRTGNTRVYVDQVTPPREVIMSVSIGVPFPLHAGGSSKAFLAFLPEEQIDVYLSHNLASLTKNTITKKGPLRKELALIRKRGWAQSSSERQLGAASVAAPVFNHLREPEAVISICGPSERFDDEASECAEHLLKATRQLSTQIGFQHVDPE